MILIIAQNETIFGSVTLCENERGAYGDGQKIKTSFLFSFGRAFFSGFPSGRTNEVKLLMLKTVSDKRLFEPSAACKLG